jgi:multiphosphoryl transfer protein
VLEELTMSQTYEFTLQLPNGLHARPASHLQAVARQFTSATTLVNTQSGTVANAKSVLSLVAANVRRGDPCQLIVSGVDEQAALNGLTAFIRDVLPSTDEPLPAPTDTDGKNQRPLPRSLLAAGLDRPLRGTSVTAGIGIGSIVVVGSWAVPPEVLSRPSKSVTDEELAFENARQSVSSSLASKLQASSGAVESAVLTAHVAIANDVELGARVKADIAAGRSAVQAVAAAMEHFSFILAASESAYLRERALDVRDVGGQLLQSICGVVADAAQAVVLDRPSIVAAHSLTPGQLLRLDRRYFSGLVLGHGASTSHTVILARSMGVPTVVGVADAIHAVADEQAIVDADLGLVVISPIPSVRAYYQTELEKQRQLRESLAANRKRPGATADNRLIDVGINVASAEEVAPGIEKGGQGVGLFRTEMIFMDRATAPTEDEQADIYSRAAAAASGAPVIIRLLDAGGDKPIPYLNLPTEANPFLGYRAVRFYPDYRGLIVSQLRAILRATMHGDVRVMVPMVCCVEEVRAVRVMISEAAASLAAEGRPIARLPLTGIMVEVPSVAMIMDRLCDEVDFFSIGSNDLTQYLLAADRDNPRVAGLYGWSHPAFLRLLKSIVDGAHAKGKWVGLCGEMADVPAALPVLIGLGLDELSVAGPRVPAVKQAIAGLRYDKCRTALETACQCATRAEAEAAIAVANNGATNLPLLALDLIELNSAAATKAEAIKFLTDALRISGRTNDERAVEEAVWQREDTYSTGFGYGLAMPHCKTEAVAASSIVVARLSRPIEWGSLDGEPVNVVILLAIRALGAAVADEHMRIFARLSRLVMREEFRDRLKTESNAAQLLAFLRECLAIPNSAPEAEFEYSSSAPNAN